MKKNELLMNEKILNQVQKLSKEKLEKIRLDSIIDFGDSEKYALNKIQIYTLGDVTKYTHEQLDELFNYVIKDTKSSSIAYFKKNLIEFVEEMGLSLKDSDKYFEKVRYDLKCKNKEIIDFAKADSYLKKVKIYLDSCYSIDDIIKNIESNNIVPTNQHKIQLWIKKNEKFFTHVFGEEETQKLMKYCIETSEEEIEDTNNEIEDNEKYGVDIIDEIDIYSILEVENENNLTINRINQKRELMERLKQALEEKKELEKQELKLNKKISSLKNNLKL